MVLDREGGILHHADIPGPDVLALVDAFEAGLQYPVDLVEIDDPCPPEERAFFVAELALHETEFAVVTDAFEMRDAPMSTSTDGLLLIAMSQNMSR